MALLVGLLVVSMISGREIWRFLFMPVHLLVISDGNCIGTELYVDGRRTLRITGKGDVLHFRRGLHMIEARRPGYRSAQAHFEALDWEQGSTTEVYLGCRKTRKGGYLILRIE